MTITKRLIKKDFQEVIEIFEKLGWDNVTSENILILPTGTKEEKKIVLDKVKKGDIYIFNKPIFNGNHDEDIQLSNKMRKFILFCIAVGTDANRTSSIILNNIWYFRNKDWKIEYEELFQILKTKSIPYINTFIDRACKNRWSSNSESFFAQLVLKLVYEISMNIPNTVEYITDWIVSVDTSEVPLPIIKDRFLEHLEIAVTFDIPVSAKLCEVIIYGVKNELLSREKAVELLFIAMDITISQSTRRLIIKAMDNLNITDYEIYNRVDNIIPILSYGDSVIIYRFAPILIKHIDSESLQQILAIFLSSKVEKTRKIVIQAALQIEKPNIEDITIVEPLLQNIIDENKSTGKLAKKLATNWGLCDTNLEDNQNSKTTEIKNLWIQTPQLWKPPVFEIGDITKENLLKVVTKIIRNELDFTIWERFYSLVTQLSYVDIENAKDVIKIFKGTDYFYNFQGIISEKSAQTQRKTTNNYSQRDVEVAKNFGIIPCLLSTPNFVDLTTTLKSITEALQKYDNLNLNVGDADLQLALQRLKITSDIGSYITENKETIKILENLKPCVELIDGTIVPVKVSKIILDYIKDPFVPPMIIESKSKHGDKYYLSDIKKVKSLSMLPYRGNCSFNLIENFPYGSDAYGCSPTYWNRPEIQSLKNLGQVLSPYSTGLFLESLIQGNYVQMGYRIDVLEEFKIAFERGLLDYKNIKIKYLFNRYLDNPKIDSISNIVNSMRSIADNGMLSIAWTLCIAVLNNVITYEKLPNKTYELLIFIQNFLPEVQNAIDKGIATQSVLDLNAVIQISNKYGNSKSVKIAKNIVKNLTNAKLDAYENIQNKEIVISKDIEYRIKNWLQKTKSYESSSIRSDKNLKFETVKLPNNSVIIKITLDNMPNDIFYSSYFTMTHHIFRLKQMYVLKSSKEDTIIDIQNKLYNSSQNYDKNNFGYLAWDDNKENIEFYKEEVRFKTIEAKKEIEDLQKEEIKDYNKIQILISKNKISSYITLELLQIAVLNEIIENFPSYYYLEEIFKKCYKTKSLNENILQDVIRPLIKMEFVKVTNILLILKRHFNITMYVNCLFQILKVAEQDIQKTNKIPKYLNSLLDILLNNVNEIRIMKYEGYLKEEYASFEELNTIVNMKNKSVAKQKAIELKKLFSQEYNSFSDIES
ncbi:MAG: hypothetical protein FWF57_05950 [Defluviitaleaceae bacterium]|nr:hypothetical protein [Defluviitaleaceae bacterium]